MEQLKTNTYKELFNRPNEDEIKLIRLTITTKIIMEIIKKTKDNKIRNITVNENA